MRPTCSGHDERRTTTSMSSCTPATWTFRVMAPRVRSQNWRGYSRSAYAFGTQAEEQSHSYGVGSNRHFEQVNNNEDEDGSTHLLMACRTFTHGLGPRATSPISVSPSQNARGYQQSPMLPHGFPRRQRMTASSAPARRPTSTFRLSAGQATARTLRKPSCALSCNNQIYDSCATYPSTEERSSGTAKASASPVQFTD